MSDIIFTAADGIYVSDGTTPPKLISTDMPICQCDHPSPFQRPSGLVICLHPHCGGVVVAKVEPVEKP